MNFWGESIVFSVNHYVFLQVVDCPEFFAFDIVLGLFGASKELKIFLCERFEPLLHLAFYLTHSLNDFFILIANFHDEIDKANSLQIGKFGLNYVLNCNNVFSDCLFRLHWMIALFRVPFFLTEWILTRNYFIGAVNIFVFLSQITHFSFEWKPFLTMAQLWKSFNFPFGFFFSLTRHFWWWQSLANRFNIGSGLSSFNGYHIVIVIVYVRLQDLRYLLDFIFLCLVVYWFSQYLFYVKFLFTLLNYSFERKFIIFLLLLLVESLTNLQNFLLFTGTLFVLPFIVWFIFFFY